MAEQEKQTEIDAKQQQVDKNSKKLEQELKDLRKEKSVLEQKLTEMTEKVTELNNKLEKGKMDDYVYVDGKEYRVRHKHDIFSFLEELKRRNIPDNFLCVALEKV